MERSGLGNFVGLICLRPSSGLHSNRRISVGREEGLHAPSRLASLLKHLAYYPPFAAGTFFSKLAPDRGSASR